MTDTGRALLAALGPAGVLALAACAFVAFGALVVLRSGRTIAFRVEDHNSGKHIGGLTG